MVAICVDKDYRDAALSSSSKRNCKLEYSYAMKRKQDFVIPVIMDHVSLDKSKWGGKLFMLSEYLHADLTSDEEIAFEEGVDKIVREMIKKRPLLEKRVKT